jgi:predicted signal transduction protein with EAL and GGDEF domain
MTRTRQRALQGALFGTATALGWVLLECAVGLHPGREISRQPFLYAYLLLGALVGFALFGGLLGRSEDRLLAANARMDEMAVSDPLTGLRNVRYFRARLAEAEAQARRSGEPLPLIVLDLDDFKQVNDRYGHDTGDAVLLETAAAIRSVVR